jgi:hypothetical protein
MTFPCCLYGINSVVQSILNPRETLLQSLALNEIKPNQLWVIPLEMDLQCEKSAHFSEH